MVVAYIPCCLTPTLLTGLSSPCEAWGILHDRENKLRISETYSPMWAWPRVRLLTNYVGGLHSRMAHLPAPPQSADLTNKTVLLFKQALPALAPTLVLTIPEPVLSSQTYKLLLPPSPAEKLRAALWGTNRPAPNLTLGAIPHTPPIPGTATIMTAA